MVASLSPLDLVGLAASLNSTSRLVGESLQVPRNEQEDFGGRHDEREEKRGDCCNPETPRRDLGTTVGQRYAPATNAVLIQISQMLEMHFFCGVLIADGK